MTAPQTPPPQPTPPPDTGLAPNVAGALSYLLGPITGILFLIISRDRFVRFHAMQCIGVTIAWVALAIVLMIIGFILGAIPFLGWIVDLFLWLAVSVAGFILWLVLMYQAFQGREWEVPVIGQQVRRYAVPGPR